MASNIKFKRSSVQNRVPTTAQLELGELALNTYDGKLYTEINTGSAAVVEIGSKLSSLVVDGDNGGGNGDVTFHGATAGRDVTWDASANRLEFADDAIASWGSSADLRIHHNGNHSYVSDYGTGNLLITGSTVNILNSSANETMISCIEDAEVDLYHNNAIRVTTTVDGADISGTGSLKIPVGTTAQRSASPTAGDLRYNTTTGGFEGYSTDWGEIGAGGVGIGSTSVNPGSGVMGTRIGVGFTDINFVGAGLSVTGYGSTVVVDISDAVSRRYGRNVYTYTATEGQTTFTGLSYTNATKQISVYLNGAKLSAATYTATSGNTVVLATGASVGDNVEILEIFSGVDLSRKLHSFTATAGQTTFTGLSYLKKKDLDVYLNGIKLAQSDYTAIDGGSIVLSTGASVNDLIEVVDMGAGATWSSGGTEPEDVYRLDGGVGIGTSNPTDKLNVIGNARIVGILTVGTGSVTIDNTTVKTGTTNVHSTGVELANINTGGSTATFGGDLSIPDTIVHTGDTNTKIRFPAADTITAETGGSERLRIVSDGKMGLGTNNPRHKLQVAGDVVLTYQTGNTITNGLFLDPGDTGAGNRPDIVLKGAGTSALSVKAFQVYYDNGGTESFNIDYEGNVFSGKSITVAEKLIHHGDTDTFLEFGTNTISFDTGGSERLTIASDRVIIGQALSNNQPTYDASTTLVTSSTNNAAAWNAIAIISGHTSGASFLKFGDKDDEDASSIGHYNADNSLRVSTGGANERLRITSAGQVLVGTTSNRAINAHAPRLQVSGTDYSTSTVSLVNNAADATGAYLFFTKQRSGSAGGSTAVAQDDIIGDIRFTAGDGTDVETGAARITVVAESNASSNSVPSYMRFSTTSTTTPVERLRITSAGNIGINTTNPQDLLHIGGTSTGLRFTANQIKFDRDSAASYIDQYGTGSIVFRTTPSGSQLERLTIASDGKTTITNAELAVTSTAAYTTHLNYNNAGTNYITSANGGGTYFRGSDNGITGMIVLGSGQVDIESKIRHIGDTDTFIEFDTNTVKLQTGGTARVTVTDATTTVANNLTVSGNLQIDGTTTTVNTATMTVDDKNIVLGSGAANDAAADGGGITLESGDGNKTWNWVDATDAWTSSEHINIASNSKRLKLGAAQELDIYHNGTDSKIRSNAHPLKLESDSIILKAYSNSDVALTSAVNGAVEVYHNNIKKLETISTGIKVLGSEGGNAEIEIFGDEGDDNNDKWKLMTNANANFYLQNYGAGSWQNSILARPTGATELYNTGNLKLATTTTGVDVTGTCTATTFSGSGASLTNVNATTLDSIDSGSFLRSDAADTCSGQMTFTNTVVMAMDGNNQTQGGVALVVRHATTSAMRANHFIHDDVPSGKATYYIQATEAGVSNDRNMCLQGYGGKVKIGAITNPSEKLDVTGNIAVSGTVDGRDVAADGSKLDTYQANGSSYLRSDANDTTTGVLTINTSSAYALTVGGSNDGKIALNGTNPYIRFQEGGTNKAYLQWNSNGSIYLVNQESGDYLRIGDGTDGLMYNIDGSTKTVWHSGNFTPANYLTSNASDTMSGVLTLNTNSNYPLNINGSSDAKIVLQGSNTPYIRFREGSTDKAYIQWTTAGILQFVNQESGEYLRIGAGTDGLRFTEGGNERIVWHAGNKPDPANASNLSSGTVAAARLPQQELGKSIVGNFGQWQGHSTYNNFDTTPAYWGWNYINGSNNAPNTNSSQWYRNRVSLGSEYGFGSDSGDYWLEMAYPRYNLDTAGTLWIRTCEAGSEGSWNEIGTKPTQTINTKTIALKAGYTIRRGDHHTGHLEGSYNNIGGNAAKTNPIYTIGSSYNPNDAALSNMYGIGYTKGTAASFLNSLPGQANAWGMYVAGDGDARVFLDGQNGHINAAGHLYCDRVYVDKQTARYLSDVTGSYGSLQINGGGSGNWQGYSIQGRVVFMHDGSSGSGIFDDVNDHWFIYGVHNSYVELRHTNNTRIRTSTAGVSVYDSVQLEGGKIRRTNHHTGHLEGSYNNVGANSAKSNPIYTIGSNYNPTDAGLSNMYGIGYSHGDATFTPTGASWGMYVAADGDARIFLDASNSRVYIGTTGNRYISQVTGSYGTFQCNEGGAGGWEGWSIDGRAVFMHDGGSGTGIFNDVDNHWLFYATHGGNSEMRCNNTARITADNSGAVINGRVTASGTSSFDNIINNYNTTQTCRGRFNTSQSGQNASNAPDLAGTPGTLSYAFGYQEASGTSNGGWSSPFPDLVFGYHTGVRIGGHQTYQGTRFYNDHPSRTSTKLFSIGEGDSHTRVYYDFLPSANNNSDLGSSSRRFANLYVNDLQLSNEAKKETGGNDVDGTWGDWTLQEGEDHIYMINNRTGKKFKMNLTEVS